jgi:hypothetical protein
MVPDLLYAERSLRSASPSVRCVQRVATADAGAAEVRLPGQARRSRQSTFVLAQEEKTPALKTLLRRYGLKCLSVEVETASQTGGEDAGKTEARSSDRVT